MNKTKKCIGFPMGVKCDGLATRNPHWCNECDTKRINHISKRMEEMAERFELEAP